MIYSDVVKTTSPREEYIEGFCILWNTINNKLISPFTENIIHQYFNYIINTINSYEWNVRIEFMIEDIIETYNKKYGSTHAGIKITGVAKVDR